MYQSLRQVEYIQKLSWEEVKEEVKQCNPALFSLVEELNPKAQFPLFKIRYPYGAKIVDNGLLQIPVSPHIYLSNYDTKLNKELAKNLSYCPIPLTLLLNRDSEIFVETGKRVIPLQYLQPGQFFGLFETLSPYPHNRDDPKPIWRVAAGARTLFMLPKISDTIGHNRLRKVFHLHNEPPKKLTSHWQIFGEIANHPMFMEKRWYSDILVFSKPWFKEQSNNNAWLKFKNYLLEQAWLESQLLREKSTFGYLWETLSTIALKNFRTKPYFIESVKHIMLIATGARPGFSPVSTDRQAAPIDILQEAYLDVYGLKHYPPILMQPKRFSAEDKDQAPVYYSLAYPTVLHHALELDNLHRTMPEMREIIRLMTTIQKRTRQETKITYLLNKVRYAYFHSEKDVYGEVELTDKITERNKFWKTLLQKYPGREFPVAAPFLRGVVQITSA